MFTHIPRIDASLNKFCPNVVLPVESYSIYSNAMRHLLLPPVPICEIGMLVWTADEWMGRLLYGILHCVRAFTPMLSPAM